MFYLLEDFGMNGIKKINLFQKLCNTFLTSKLLESSNCYILYNICNCYIYCYIIIYILLNLLIANDYLFKMSSKIVMYENNI